MKKPTRHASQRERYRWAYYRLFRACSLVDKTAERLRPPEAALVKVAAEMLRGLREDFYSKWQICEAQHLKEAALRSGGAR